ncbi:serine protein kinase RIO [archaeon]|nr:serine protein kinase RIO [archaeon]
MEEINPRFESLTKDGIEKQERQEKPERKIFAKVFDEQTLKVIDCLSRKGLIDALEFVISPGKEAEVYRAVDIAGNYRAVKIYKIETSGFRKMQDYLKGDYRFKKIGRGQHEIIFNWTKKEFRNLLKMSEAKARVPMPIGFKNNVLVMEFIGVDGKAGRQLKDLELDRESLEKALKQVIESYARMFFKAGLIHADLSEYNILVRQEKGKIEAVIIDCGQAVPKSHPKSREFFERDLKNLSNYFSKKGLAVSVQELKELLKKAGNIVK